MPGAQASLRSGSVPIWVDVPGFLPLKRFVERRAADPASLRGRLVVAVDNDGQHASAFLANQARCCCPRWRGPDTPPCGMDLKSAASTFAFGGGGAPLLSYPALRPPLPPFPKRAPFWNPCGGRGHLARP